MQSANLQRTSRIHKSFVTGIANSIAEFRQVVLGTVAVACVRKEGRREGQSWAGGSDVTEAAPSILTFYVLFVFFLHIEASAATNFVFPLMEKLLCNIYSPTVYIYMMFALFPREKNKLLDR